MILSRVLTTTLFALLAASPALALPSQTLFVQASHLDEPTVTYYTAYGERPANASAFGSSITPMNEAVADTLLGLTLDQVYECTARVFVNQRHAYVYELTGCR